MSQTGAVLVSDLTGFTKSTREHGIRHMTAIILRMRQILYPTLHKHHASFITTEADNFIVLFPTIVEAVAAAIEMVAVVRAYNATAPPTFKIHLNGIGIDHGPVVVSEGRLYGKPFATAYHLGEDVCSNERILVTVRGLYALPYAKYGGVARSERGVEYFDVRSEYRGDSPSLPPLTDGRYLGASLLPLLNPKHTLPLSRHVVLMFEVFNQHGDGIREVVASHGGTYVEEELHLFPDAQSALRAAIALRADANISTKGFGIAAGELLIVKGTDVHWGDPVNTASKLGQDIATYDDILVTDDIKTTAEERSFEALDVDCSHVHFSAWRLVA